MGACGRQKGTASRNGCDLLQKNVEVIVAATSLGGVAAKKATRTIPIVVLGRCSTVKAQRTYGPRALAEHLGTARTPLVC